MKLLAYHNDPSTKLKYQNRYEEHRKADEVVQGLGYSKGRGCFVGCTLDAYDHSRFPTELGWPEWLAHLADKIFEGLSKEEAPEFGFNLLEAVQAGQYLEPVRWQLAALRHGKHLAEIAELADKQSKYAVEVKKALKQVIAYCEDTHKTEKTRAAAQSAAQSAAHAATHAAAQAAAWVARAARAAACAAKSAPQAAQAAACAAAHATTQATAHAAMWLAHSASESVTSARSARSARSVAESVAWSVAWSAARAEIWQQTPSKAQKAALRWERDTLLKLIRAL